MYLHVSSVTRLVIKLFLADGADVSRLLASFFLGLVRLFGQDHQHVRRSVRGLLFFYLGRGFDRSAARRHFPGPAEDFSEKRPDPFFRLKVILIRLGRHGVVFFAAGDSVVSGIPLVGLGKIQRLGQNFRQQLGKERSSRR